MSIIPEEGIYEDIPFSDYLSWDAISNSRLSLMAKSPRHFKLGFCKEPTPAMQLGQLYHCGVLEPLAFAGRYAICPNFHTHPENCTAAGVPSNSTATKYVKDKVREFTALADGREVVTKEWYDNTLALVKELTLNDDAKRIMNDPGPRELSIVWEDGDILCKARIDKVAAGIIADLKSTAAIDAFSNAIGRYGYHRQMAHYQSGWKELTGDTLTPWLIAVESSAPFAVQAAPMSDEAMEIGYGERRRLMNRLRDCLEADRWPGMANPKHWNLPAWATEQESVELVFGGLTIEV